MFSSDSDKNGRINIWMFSGGICASWLITHSVKSVPEERALTASLPLCCCSLFQMWPSISVGVWLLCRQWSNWSSLTLMYWPKWIFYLTSETLTGNVPSRIKVLESLWNCLSISLASSASYMQRWRMGFPRFLDPDARLLLEDLNIQTAPRFKKLNRALAGLVCIHLHSYNTRHSRNNDLV